MLDKRMLLVEPLLQDKACSKPRAVRFLLIGLGVAAFLSQVPCTLLIGKRVLIAQPAIGMYWNFVEPMAFFRHEEQPIEPFDNFRHFVEPPMIPEEENEHHNFDLWPRQSPAKVPQHEEAPFNMFPQRDPFKEMRREADLPAGHYVSRSFASASHVGPDGKMVTERYAASAAGNGNEGIHEAKHLYSNSSSGLERASHEQHLRGRSRMAVTEFGKGVQGTSNHIFHGMNETENSVFGQDFDMAARHLPDRVKLGREAIEAPSNNFQDWASATGYGNRHVTSMLDPW
jgi:hypothetical protein